MPKGVGHLKTRCFGIKTKVFPWVLGVPGAFLHMSLSSWLVSFGMSPTCQAWRSKQAAEADPSGGLEEFYGFRHERVMLEAVEESYRDCLRQGG